MVFSYAWDMWALDQVLQGLCHQDEDELSRLLEQSVPAKAKVQRDFRVFIPFGSTERAKEYAQEMKTTNSIKECVDEETFIMNGQQHSRRQIRYTEVNTFDGP